MSFLRLLAATLAVGVVPGALITLLWRPRSELTLLETAGFGVAISFGVVQLLTILAIAAHLSPAIILVALGVGCAIILAAIFVRGTPKVVVPIDEIILSAMLVVLGALLYRLGSPVEWFEDQVHVAIVRRLTSVRWFRPAALIRRRRLHAVRFLLRTPALVPRGATGIASPIGVVVNALPCGAGFSAFFRFFAAAFAFRAIDRRSFAPSPQ